MLQFDPDSNFSIPVSALSTSGVLSIAPVNNVAPVISGTPTVGSTLTATTGTWTGDPAPTYAYQWKRNGSPLGGANASTYVVVSGDLGTSITCTVTATNSAGNSSATSNALTVVAAPVNTVAPVISGTPTAGSTLTATTGTWTGSPTPTYTYKWYDTWGERYGYTSSTYVVESGLQGLDIRCLVTATNSAGNATAYSNALTVVAAPVNAVAPVVSVSGGGAPLVGSTLLATTGSWTGHPAPTYTYQWRKNTVSIGGATSSSYVPVSGDLGASITCTVTATNSEGNSPATSNAISIVAAPVNTIAPVISGTPNVGQTLTSTTGTWTGSPTPTYAYQWRKNTVDIGGATASTYVPVSGDATALISCRVTATNSAGSAGATSNSLTIAAAVEFAKIASVLTGGNVGGVTSGSIDTTGADLLIIVVAYADNYDPTISDSKGNTWTALTAIESGINFYPAARIYWCKPSSVGSGHTASASAGGSYASIWFAGFSGSHASPFDVQNGALRTSSGTTHFAGPVTPSAISSLIIQGLSASGTGIVPTLPGYAVEYINDVGGSHQALAVGWKEKAAATMEFANWSLSSASSYIPAVAAVFKS